MQQHIKMWLVLGITLSVIGNAMATSLTQDVNLKAATPVLTATPDSITPDGTLYSWADKNGDGVANDPVDAGLDLGQWNLTRLDDTLGFTLDLHDGTNPGAITWGGVAGGLISTKKVVYGNKDGGPITIRGVTDITCDTINTSGNGTGHGGNLTVEQSGNLSVSRILAKPAYTGRTAGEIKLLGAGGLTGTPSGSCNVDKEISNRAEYGYANNILIAGYAGVAVGEDGITCVLPASIVKDFSIVVTNIGTAGVNVTGLIAARAEKENGTYRVNIQTLGDVNLSRVDTHRGNGGSWVNTDAGDITIVADGNINVSDSLETYMLGGQGYSRNSGDIDILSNNGWVKLNHIDTTNKTTSAYRAGDVNVSAYSDVTIAGDILMSSARDASYNGNLAISTTGNGKISLAALDLGRVGNAAFDSSQKWSLVEGAFDGFNTAATGGSGTPADPLQTSQTKLRTPAGQNIYYNYEAGQLNDYLGGQTYRIADLSGVAGAGGLLRPQPIFGTLLMIK